MPYCLINQIKLTKNNLGSSAKATLHAIKFSPKWNPRTFSIEFWNSLEGQASIKLLNDDST